MEFIRDFKNLSKNDTAIAGGKGAALGEIIQAGIPVPPGFVVLSTAFEKFLKETDLNIEIDSILHSVNSQKMHALEKSSEKIKTLILNAKMPKIIENEIQKFFKKLNSQFVAVRSSATAEDSSVAAWAGQLESYLNTTESNLLENVKKCWASLFTPRAIFYRFEKKLHKQKISVAVVVQKMIESESSGVAFSIHPITQDKNQLIIEAGFGLGEAVVSGRITPDRYVIEKKNKKILDKNINEQKKLLSRSHLGINIWNNLPKSKAQQQKLSDIEISKLSKLLIKIEKHYNFPVDIEWAKEKGAIYIIQSRPITTIKNLRNEKFADKFIRITQDQDLYPQVSSIVIFTPRISGYSYGGFYKDTTPTPYVTIMKEGHDSFVFVPETKFKNTAREIFQKYWRNPKFISGHIKKINKCINDLDNIYFLYDHKKIINTPIDKLLNVARKTINVNRQLNTLIWSVIYFNEEFCLELLEKNNIKISTARLKQIWQKGSIPSFQSFDKIRHLNVLNLMKRQTKWSDIAEKCQFYFANYNSVANIEFVKRELQKQYEKYLSREIKGLLEKAKEEEKKKLKEHTNWVKKLNRNERKLVIYLQAIIKIRDIRKDAVSQALAIVHRIAGRIFDKVKINKELIKYCACDEILYGLEYLKDNRKNLERRKDGVVMMFFVDNNEPAKFEYGTYNETKAKLEKYYQDKQLSSIVQQNEMKGQIACLGKVAGIVKIVNDPKKAKNFKKGNILVTSMTRPEFVPLMKIAGAIVTNEGGITSHAAIISRELNIPCIIGTKIATKFFKNGDNVEVDANNGIVRILKIKVE